MTGAERKPGVAQLPGTGAKNCNTQDTTRQETDNQQKYPGNVSAEATC